MVAYGPLPSFHDIAQPLRALLTEHLSARCCPPALQVRLDPEVGGQAGVSNSEAPGGRPSPHAPDSQSPRPAGFCTRHQV